MTYLIIVSLIWAFSFGLIKDQLAGLDSSFVSAARLFVSFLVFLPFLRLRNINRKLRWQLILIGAVEYGLMYITYIHAFKYLQAYEVALFTIFTPIYVTLINDAFNKKFNIISLGAALLAVIGTAIVKQFSTIDSSWMTGFLIMQVSNLCFAFGQIYYKKLLGSKKEIKDHQIFGIVYLGAFLTAGLASAFFTPWQAFSITSDQIIVLLYLGAVASGLGFFLWNMGARLVNAGTLAVFNDLKIPLAVLVALIIFHETADVPSLLIGGSIILAGLFLNEWGLKRKIAFQEN